MSFRTIEEMRKQKALEESQQCPFKPRTNSKPPPRKISSAEMSETALKRCVELHNKVANAKREARAYSVKSIE